MAVAAEINIEMLASQSPNLCQHSDLEKYLNHFTVRLPFLSSRSGETNCVWNSSAKQLGSWQIHPGSYVCCWACTRIAESRMDTRKRWCGRPAYWGSKGSFWTQRPPFNALTVSLAVIWKHARKNTASFLLLSQVGPIRIIIIELIIFVLQVSSLLLCLLCVF